MVDGELTDEEHEPLAELLRTSVPARSLYADCLQQHAILHWEHTSSSKEVSPRKAASAAEQSANAPTPKPVQHLWRRLRRTTPLSLTVAALVIGLMLTAMAFMTPPFYRVVSEQEGANNLDARRIVARLTGLRDVAWSDENTAARRGAHLLTGRRIALNAGMAEVTFRDGAVVVLRGPAVFIATNQNAARLLDGFLVARVPDSAQGFVVTTPHATVTDLGTEFGVAVRSDQKTLVHVNQGIVTVAASERSNAPPQRLTAGETMVAEGSRLRRMKRCHQGTFNAPLSTSTVPTRVRRQSACERTLCWRGQGSRLDDQRASGV